jgi:hypothetical protein
MTAIEPPPILTASVKVMRSYDYCHFEVCLSSDAANCADAVDALRKEAALLADKAVEQYKIAKENAQLAENDKLRLETLRYRHEPVLAKPEGERTPEDKAIIKTIEDRAHRNRPRYNYEDHWEEPEYPEDDESDRETF